MKKLLLVDGNAQLHRAYHAIPPLTTRSGEQVNAIFGFWSLFLRSLKDLEPDGVVFTFDKSSNTFRHDMYDKYKATRQKMEPDLAAQIPRLKEVVAASRMPVLELEGFEADDLIGTMARQAFEGSDACQVYIMTADMDAAQLVNERVSIYTAKHKISEVALYDVAGIIEKFKGLRPDQIVDYKALRGDSSDNIPGVAGVGEKTATDLLLRYQHLDPIYEHLTELPNRAQMLLEQGKDLAYLSQKLATINTEAPVSFDFEASDIGQFDGAAVGGLFRELEFRSLVGKLPVSERHATSDKRQEYLRASLPVTDSLELGGENLDRSEKREERSQPLASYVLVENAVDLQKIVDEIKKSGEVAFDTETTGVDVWRSDVLGVSCSVEAGTGYYIPVAEWSIPLLKSWLEDESIKKIAHNAKFDVESLLQVGIEVAGVSFDTMLAAYVLKEGTGRYGLKELAFEELGINATPITELIGTGSKQLTLDMVDQQEVAQYAGADADHTWQLYKIYKPQFEDQDGLRRIFFDIEMPVSQVLTSMERKGIVLDSEFLAAMSTRLSEQIGLLEQEIYADAGHEFNINSPKQLGDVLFDELHLPVNKKTKTGRSTDESVLQGLKGAHPIIERILQYRELYKLRSTYVDALPQLVSPRDGRIHTSYNQAVAATGRLSSTNPNLQNIPIKTEVGRRIRQAFLANQGQKLVSIDYSQIELRLLAYVSGDKNLIEAFASGEDVHKATAAKVFNCSIAEVTSDQRRVAKTINFGIMYGQSAHGLSQQLGIGREQAATFISDYFKVYDGVRAYLDSSIAEAHKQGFVETVFGRRRRIPELASKNFMLRQGAERMAINMPIQGAAADIIKIAMIAVDGYLENNTFEAQMLLQVHDELVFSMPESEIAVVVPKIVGLMENVGEFAEDKKPTVQLVAEAKVGDNWGEMVALD